MGCDDLTGGLVPPDGLQIAGHCRQEGATVFLIAPDEPQFWHVFTASNEFSDGRPDPLDRWSKRVIGPWAAECRAEAVFPSDGPPFPPFIGWALASGRCWSSPTGMLVHDRMGLFISFRGALIVDGLDLPTSLPRPSPCRSCARPCLTACPADAFAGGFDDGRCHGFLATRAGSRCLNRGCDVRVACPISKGCGRLPEQSAWHMRQYHP